MKKTQPDFYLASTESYNFETPRRCFTIKRLRGERRDDYLLIKIEPPIIGQKYGLGSLDIQEVIVATRYKGDSLFPVSNWPLDVHIARLLNKPSDDSTLLRDNQYEEIAWGELYPDEESARAAMG